MRYDVVVVGAGPAGSTAAKFLSENEVKVLLLDKSKFPRDKPCGGGIPIRTLRRFRYIEEKDLIESYSYGGCLHSSSPKCKVEIPKNEPLIAMVRREKFDHGLVKFAIEGGATFLDGKTVQNINVLDDKVRIKIKDDTEIESQVVIGADGVWSTVAKQCGLSSTHRNVGMGLVREIPMSTETLDEYFTEKRVGHVHIKFQGLTGYGWVFPKKQHLNIGICEFESHADKSRGEANLKETYNNYIELLKQDKMIPDAPELERCRGAALPLRPLAKTYTDRVVLCGDAAGLINPATGEGIDYAMSSGQIAAGVIVDALEASDTSEKYLSKYESLWKNDFGRDIKICLRVQKRWREQSAKLIQLASRDKRIAEMAVEVGTGNLRISECRFELAKRLLYLYFKDLLHMN